MKIYLIKCRQKLKTLFLDFDFIDFGGSILTQKNKKIPSGFIYFFGSFGGILFGYDIGVMTGACRF